ncbi:MAG: glutamine synthetase beta-grasp domain-containing protein, partial [Candidatus Eremiobacteraeota bacterium]|nr:glutamine synthetase beta-grasp domain-containing protein [Candidatus Eremiobacteraeota bacterium]
MHSTLTNGKATNKRDVLRLVKEHDVRFVRLSFVDILGISKNVTVPVAELDRAIDGRVTFDGGAIDGFMRGEEADMMLLPDLSTFAV